MEDLTDYELDAAEQTASDLVDRDSAGDAAVALTVQRLVAEVRRRRAEPLKPIEGPKNEQGGTAHEIVLEEQVGMEQK